MKLDDADCYLKLKLFENEAIKKKKNFQRELPDNSRFQKTTLKRGQTTSW